MGFCPHLRCQLDSLSHSTEYNQCPAGLCYTKLEDGSLSYGACCFDSEGNFYSGNLIGVSNLSQPVAKPIYNHSRVIINDEENELESNLVNNNSKNIFSNFFNGNYLTHDLIATQCPLMESKETIYNLILQKKVKLWIQLSGPNQLSPFDLSNPNLTNQFSSNVRSGKNCHLLPSLFSSIEFNNRVKILSFFPFSSNNMEEGGVYKMLFYSSNKIDSIETSYVEGHELTFIWYPYWKDFSNPSNKYLNILNDIINQAVNILKFNKLNENDVEKERVVVSCYSGRGRSGSLSSIILSKFYNIKSHDELVNLIVKLRERRDGLVETPSQYLTILNFLNHLTKETHIDVKNFIKYQENNLNNYISLSNITSSSFSYFTNNNMLNDNNRISNNYNIINNKYIKCSEIFYFLLGFIICYIFIKKKEIKKVNKLK